MFESLDDLATFEPTDATFRSVVRRYRQRRRRSYVLRAGGTLACAALVAPALVARYEADRFDRIRRVDIHAANSTSPGETLAADTSATPTSVVSNDRPINLLVLGTDEDPARGVAGSRTDTLMLVRVDPRAGRIAVLSLPRDLWVETGTGSQRINSLFDPQHPQALIDAVTGHLGVSIDHYVAVDMTGFVELVDAVGPVSLASGADLRDDHTGLGVSAGCHSYDGREALALVRARHLEAFVDGEWTVDVRSDLGRIARQQLFARTIAAALSTRPTDITRLDAILDVLVPHAVMDSGFDRPTARALAATVQTIGPDAMEFATIETEPATISGMSVLAATDGAATAAAAWLVGTRGSVAAPVTPVDLGPGPEGVTITAC